MKPHLHLLASSKTYPVGIALGSNLGKSDQLLRDAIAKLRKIHDGPASTFLVSSIYKTKPIDCPRGSPDFVNAVLQLETSFSPTDILSLLQKLELESGRPAVRKKNQPRTLDLDLLYYNSLILSTPELILPHPKMRERLFVLEPLVEILPNLILPGWQKTAQNYLLNLQ